MNPYTILSISFDAIIVYALFLIGYTLSKSKQISEDWLCSQNDSEMRFRKPPALRHAFLLFSVFCILAFVSLVIGARVLHNSGLLYVCVNCLILFCTFVYFSGPDELTLSKAQRQYTKTGGWPWHPQTKVGSLDEMMGVCVNPRRNQIRLVSKNQGHSYTLGTNMTIVKAKALAENVSSFTGLPIIPYTPKR